jgi:magnesium chelatase family protein
VARYRGKLSGPLLDRIDLMLDVPAVAADELSASGDGESSATVRARVTAARSVQIERQGKANALLGPDEVDCHARPDEAGGQLLKHAMLRLLLTARAYHRILKVARTIADLAGMQQISSAHVAEAIHYRRGLAD